MPKPDLLVLTGFLLFGAGLFFIYHPLAFLFAGAVFVRLGQVAAPGRTSKAEIR